MRSVRAGTLLLAVAGLCSVSSGARAVQQGVDSGWVVDNAGNPILTPARAAGMAAAGVGWLRMEFRLVGGATTWNADTLGYYDVVVRAARASGLQIIGLLDNTSWRGGQSRWTAKNWEHDHGNGDNAYIDAFAMQAAVPVIRHFHNQIRRWEIWNEPNAWTSNPAPGVYTGGTFLYPSNFGQLLTRTYGAVKITGGITGVELISGGVFGHDIGGKSYGSAGAQYIDDTYNVGINKVGEFAFARKQWGTYPLDAIGQHIYIDQGGLTSGASFQDYCSWVRQAYTKYEGTGTSKRTVITEFGWSTHNLTQSNQDRNLTTAFGVVEGAAAGYVETAVWFTWQDNPAAGLYFGILDADGRPKLCYDDFKKLESR